MKRVMATLQTAKEEIRRKADIVEFISQFVQLKKAGKDFVGLCPFHGDKDPSFTVSPDKQMFHCFGCKKGGDIFAFWMAYHGGSFPEAMKDLAERYHVPIESETWSPADQRRADKREALFRINEAAAAFFEARLKDDVVGKPGRDYLESRSVSEDVRTSLRLGYAPDSWHGLANELKRRGADLSAAAEAGLIARGERQGYYDRFRGRIIFPIFDTRKKLVGFGGRVLGDGHPKYLNTPETPVFHKGAVLYGLHIALNSIRQSGRVVVVEGYMDFLTLFQAGLPEVVATLGTALTREHIRSLKGCAKEVFLVFDADAAGRNAALRSLPLFLQEGLQARAAELPPGEDPDSLVRKGGLASFNPYLEKAPLLFDFFLAHKARVESPDHIEALMATLREVLPVLAEIQEEAPRRLYVKRLAEHLHLQEEIIWPELAKVSGAKQTSPAHAERIETVLIEKETAKRFGSDLQLLNLVLHHPEKAVELSDCQWRCLAADRVVIEIIEVIFRRGNSRRPPRYEELQDRLDSDEARMILRETLMRPSFFSEADALLAVTEFKHRIEQKEIAASIQKAKAEEDIDIHALDRLRKLKAKRLAELTKA
ncbi:DNA primase [uncultured Desulfatiglans sp.]|uniref:DNA primase n=1 Tax=Uncultured Desulfatiglans sp. TaxID=1748965 RepID=A0A653A174_UNCDX|nr:DNA primase [uncultured Desulfatiglans sp.]